VSDIVKRLRAPVDPDDPNLWTVDKDRLEAAARIEALEKQLFSDIRAETEIERLETRIEALKAALRDIVEAGDFWEMDSIARKALAEGQDAP
jgi:hypothetical protein